MVEHFPKIQRINVSDLESSLRLDFEVRKAGRKWVAKALRLSEGRVLRARKGSAPPLNVESIKLEAETYQGLVEECKNYLKNKGAGEVSVLDSQAISESVKDWENRVRDLYKLIREYLQGTSYSVDEGSKVEMNEDLMQSFFIEPKLLPTLEVKDKESVVLVVKPKGLWVIGANGRIDLLTRKGTYQLLDFAPRDGTSEWVLYGENRKKSGFSKAVINRLVANERVW